MADSLILPFQPKANGLFPHTAKVDLLFFERYDRIELSYPPWKGGIIKTVILIPQILNHQRDSNSHLSFYQETCFRYTITTTSVPWHWNLSPIHYPQSDGIGQPSPIIFISFHAINEKGYSVNNSYYQIAYNYNYYLCAYERNRTAISLT